ncbi:dTDP-6-deoxy-L-mannose dehydrogenase RmlD [Legionella beliardensis]|uniref:dTDP-4-dehydrorhamnose reductase n=1 Tax=Legionella beliardensis TaxID=91822 RepID=A0A378I5G1_9GAMM|nr:dTDP-4-dehydrorhamnose reductase [Legionella beliardensis]STX27714.1 dTDP-6-deoxy-L-mannose dehydrogenase RmlD [Legionella beliardensis]
MKILLFGKNGQLGWELQRALAPLGELIALDRHSTLTANLENLAGIATTIRTVKPDIIVNAAAYTAVDKAESEQDLAILINAKAPAVLAQEGAKTGSLLVHYSTDYVFDGSNHISWQENDAPSPLNFYGVSKLQGEQEIINSGCQHLILRTSWVYGTYGKNFIKTILRLSQEKETIKIVNDQIGAPTGTELLADVTAHLLKATTLDPALSGLYHLAASGETSWYDFAHFILEEAKKLAQQSTIKNLIPIPSEDYITPAQRPLNSRLNTKKLQHAFSIHLPNWQLGAARVIREILGST